MPEIQLRQRPGDYLCGLAKWHPAWMQRYATTKSFMIVYGLLGTIQAMSYMYFVVTLTTIEKRFKIPSQTTGIILSGNEISQILLSLILSYIGGQRNRPRWIAWGIVFCGLSCYILALPHFIYGAGDGALHLTVEYLQDQSLNMTSSFSLVNASIQSSQELCGLTKSSQECESLLSIVPLVLIFLSQFVLGIGNTLYYSLGQTYLDDNTKERNTPLMLAVAMALRMIGPIVGFFLGYISLNMYIDPFKKPLIDNKDPRWLGAWWFGWMILGTLMVLFSGLIGLFPKQLPKMKPEHYNSHLPRMMRLEQLKKEDGISLGSTLSLTAALDANAAAAVDADFPRLKDFPKALMRLLRNKLLIYNIISGVFYILGAAGYMTFLSKYMEVQFHKTAQTATVIVGPISIIGMVIGLIGSGIVISKKHPSPSKVLMWNIIVGCVYILGQMSYLFMYCGDSISVQNGGNYNFTTQCNRNCSCDNVAYSPVCHEASDTTFFSACHAGCKAWNPKEKTFSNCTCIDVFGNDFDRSTAAYTPTTPTFLGDFNTQQPQPFNPPEKIISGISTTGTPVPVPTTVLNNEELIIPTTTASAWITTQKPKTTSEELLARASRSVSTLSEILTPGVCLKGCSVAFYSFTIASMIVNWFGSSGRIGNLLVNFRAVATKDKSFAQGLSLMMISLFALIPGPIIFGRMIDSTCLVWTETCHGRGNCQLYDQTKFRYYVNILALSLTSIGVVFDILVWYHGRHLDLYGEKEAQRLEEMRRKDKPITPLLAHRS
ncbi:solute carrier organic anion transporter family member 74D [Zeugodacus cucurbitae]|uniref:solute carrier organic anion transporter family member 74D n=1 Tax=Zeugodacus cucurbitae TaxID=28588 RepID=UPI0023D90ABA|nr:solute carrier organic anion transporter family member 74D [Zeugodacus cucurbitae]XP_054082783.1 solute carrier organic anion transporter family member 74D [Zeugodacus cucurbitae]XP_054082784.1 solute carrier organic anion transporter family member 74D [Zeugodacus cucurbitae]